MYDSYVDANGVTRWKSNDAVPFDDMLERMGVTGDALKRCQEARSADNAKFITQYKLAQAKRTPEQIAEQRAEAWAVHGPGVEVVNVISGEAYTT